MGRAAFVWLVFAGVFAVALWLVLTYTGRAPIQDDYYHQPFRLERGLPTRAALWAQLNEHRYPLPRLVTWAFARVAGPGVRAGTLANLGMTTLAAVALVLAVRRARGHLEYADAVLPLAVLNVSDAPSRVWAVQVNFYLPIALALAAAAVIAAGRGDPGGRRLAAAGVLAVLLVLCGVVGVVFGASLSAWLLVAATLEWRAGRRLDAVAAAGGLSALAVGASAFVGYVPPPHAGLHWLGWHTVEYFLRMLGAAWGDAVEQAHPAGWPSPVGLATGALLAVTAGGLVRAAVRGPAPVAALGLLALLGGQVAAAAAGAFGRADSTAPAGGPINHSLVTLLLPTVALLSLAWERVGGRAARRVRGGLLLAATAVAWPNVTDGVGRARNWHQPQPMIALDVALRLPASAVAEKYTWYLHPADPAPLPGRLEQLQAGRVDPFRYMAPERPLREVAVRWTAAGAVGDAAAGFPTDDRLNVGSVRVEIVPAEPIDGVRLRYTMSPGGTEGHARYSRPTGEGPPLRIVHLNALVPGHGRIVRIWVGPGTTGFTLTFAGPARLQLQEVVGLAFGPDP